MHINLKKMGLTTATALAMVMYVTTPASALVSDTSLVNSGDNADVNSNVTKVNTIDIVSENKAHVMQYMDASANSGGNTIEGNIGGGSLVTGAALVQGEFMTQANTNTVGLSLGSQGGNNGQGLEVVNTGDDASIVSNWTEHKELNVTNKNDATVYQKLYGKSNSGENHLDGNIGTGGSNNVTTGTAQVGAEMGVALNKNTTLVNGGSNPSAVQGSETSLTNTGDDAHVNTSWSSHNSLDVMNKNYANVTQMMHTYSNSGKNHVMDGIGGGNLTTGQAGFLGEFGVVANENTTGLSGLGMGSSLLGSMTELVNTGDYLHANSSLNETNTAHVSSTNYLYEKQSFEHKSNSGYNHLDGNIGGGMTHTGMATGWNGAAVNANSNATVLGSMADVLHFLALGS